MGVVAVQVFETGVPEPSRENLTFKTHNHRAGAAVQHNQALMTLHNASRKSEKGSKG
jgi:hypothetical protein